MIRNHCHVGAILVALLLALSEPAVAEIQDYLGCAMYFNNPINDEGKRTYSRVQNRPWTPDRFRYVPIKMDFDGTIRPLFDDMVVVKAGEVVTYEYQSKPLEELESEGGMGPNFRERKAMVAVERRGDVLEITESQNFSAEELAEMRKKRPQGFIYAGTYTRFEILNGECVPMEVRDMLHFPGSEQLVETVVVDTRLCRRLEKFFQTNEHARALLSADLNESVKELMQYHVLAPRDGFGEIPFEDEKEQLLSSHLSSEATHLALRSNLGNDMAGKLRAQPVVLADMTLRNCYYQHLGPFLRHFQIWGTMDAGRPTERPSSR